MATATKTTGSQFDGLLAPRKRPQAEPQEPVTAATEETGHSSKAAAAKQGSAKRLAKSKDTEYQGRTFYVRKRTYTECEYLLRNNDDPRDMSDLVEDLLTAFLVEESKSSAR